jgi:dTDP-4-dehydrorhamnose reductase
MSRPDPGHRVILLLGRDGQTGWELERCLAPLGRVVALGRAGVDLGDHAALRAVVRQHRPAAIVNAAAYNAVDKAEDEEHRALAINGEAPGVLAEEARRLGSLLIHYSTDYVFGARVHTGADGAPRPFGEDDPPAPLGAYGRSKLAGEEAITAVGCAHLIFRTSWVYSLRGRTFLGALLRLEVGKDELRVVDDELSCPTWARALAEATAQSLAVVFARDAAAADRGIYHLAGTGAVSRHGFAAAAFAIHAAAGRTVPPLAPVRSQSFPTKAQRPAYSALDCTRARQVFGISLPDWRSSLSLCLSG